MVSEENQSELEERVRTLEDRHEVEETVQKYVRAVDSQNIELLRSIFAEDSIVDVSPGETYEGPDEIVELYEEYWAVIPLMNHLILNQVVDVNVDEAVVSSYWLSRNEGQDGQPVKGGGFYIRQLEKRDGEWVHTQSTPTSHSTYSTCAQSKAHRYGRSWGSTSRNRSRRIIRTSRFRSSPNGSRRPDL